MKKKLCGLVCVLLSVCLFACSSAEAESSLSTTTKPTMDRAGLSITVPDTINSIVVLAPAIAQTMEDLGSGDHIVAIDQQTALLNLEHTADLSSFDMVTPNIEEIASLKPDLVLASSLSGGGGEDPFTQLTNMGICVAIIPTSTSVEGMQEDIRFLATLLDRQERGEEIVRTMQEQIDEIAAIGQSIPEDQRKSVYFEIAQDPSYSFGSGVFLNEFIELIGANNVFASQSRWLQVEAESAIAANPDVILTNVNYIEDPVDEILNRTGWSNVIAVKNKEVYFIDNTTSSLPNEYSVSALKEMAKAVYPEFYQ